MRSTLGQPPKPCHCYLLPWPLLEACNHARYRCPWEGCAAIYGSLRDALQHARHSCSHAPQETIDIRDLDCDNARCEETFVTWDAWLLHKERNYNFRATPECQHGCGKSCNQNNVVTARARALANTGPQSRASGGRISTGTMRATTAAASSAISAVSWRPNWGQQLQGEESCEACRAKGEECWVCSKEGAQQISKPGDACARCQLARGSWLQRFEEGKEGFKESSKLSSGAASSPASKEASSFSSGDGSSTSRVRSRTGPWQLVARMGEQARVSGEDRPRSRPAK
jgi:hypothetical protein